MRRTIHQFTIALGWLVVTLAFGGSLSAQETPSPRLGFVAGDVRTASPNDPSSTGLSRLANIVISLGYEPVTVNLDESIPEDIRALVMIGPTRELSLAESNTLYEYLETGNNALLLALDPETYRDVNTEDSNDPLSRYLTFAFGINLGDGFLAEPGFTRESLAGQDLASAKIIVPSPRRVPHVIVRPHTTHDLPLVVWAARNLEVEPIGVSSSAGVLFYTESAYSETDAGVFQQPELADDPLVRFNPEIGIDPMGRLPIAGVGLNTASGSRVIIFGDSEIFQNGYGLSLRREDSLPVHPGNFLLVERSLAWLVGLPTVQWPPLPEGYLWIAVDGNLTDWDTLDLAPRGARAVYTDHYLYVVAPAPEADTPPQGVRLQVTPPDAPSVELRGFRTDRGYQLLDPAAVALPDAALAIESHIELRVPLRLIGPQPGRITLCSVVDGEETCQDTLTATPVDLVEPAPMRLRNVPIGTVRTPTAVNLRTAPSRDAAIVDILENETQLAITGRSENNNWLRAEVGGYTGWINTPLMRLNADLQTIPVITGTP